MKAPNIPLALQLLCACLPSACGPTPVRHQMPARHILGDGRYVVEIENTGGGSALGLQSHWEGSKVTEEHFDLTWGDGVA